jgi:hypothetical protein
MIFENKFRRLTDELSIRDDTWVEFNLHCLGVVCCTAANLFVAWILHERVSTSISNVSGKNSLVLQRWEVLQKDMFDSPETAGGKGGYLGLGGGSCEKTFM